MERLVRPFKNEEVEAGVTQMIPIYRQISSNTVKNRSRQIRKFTNEKKRVYSKLDDKIQEVRETAEQENV